MTAAGRRCTRRPFEDEPRPGRRVHAVGPAEPTAAAQGLTRALQLADADGLPTAVDRLLTAAGPGESSFLMTTATKNAYDALRTLRMVIGCWKISRWPAIAITPILRPVTGWCQGCSLGGESCTERCCGIARKVSVAHERFQ